MDHKSLQTWLDKYVEAWRTYNPAQIGDLFSEDALYFYSPWDEDNPIRGREAIVAEWRKEPDQSGSWEAHYAPSSSKAKSPSRRGGLVIFDPTDPSLDSSTTFSYSTSMKRAVANGSPNGTCSRVAPNRQ